MWWRRDRALAAPLLAVLLLLGASLPGGAASERPAPPAAPPAASPVEDPPPYPFVPARGWRGCPQTLAQESVVALRAKGIGLLGRRGVHDPAAWMDAVLNSLCATYLPVSPEHVALILALIERESSFNPHGVLPNPPEGFRKLAYRVIDDLLAGETAESERLLGEGLAGRVMEVATSALRALRVLDEASLRRLFDRYYERFDWQRVTTEWDIERVFAPDVLTIAEESTAPGLFLRTLLAVSPGWRERLATGAILRTVGPLQVNPALAALFATHDRVTLSEAEARALLYTIEGGVYYGLKQLKPHIMAYAGKGPLSPSVVPFVVMDRRVGNYACRDAALARQVGELAGRNLPPDTPLRSDAVRKHLLALERELTAAARPEPREGAQTRPAHARAVDQFLELAGKPELEQTEVYQGIRAAYRRRFGREPERGLIPRASFYSAKTGRYSLGKLSQEIEERFASNCVLLGCGP